MYIFMYMYICTYSCIYIYTYLDIYLHIYTQKGGGFALKAFSMFTPGQMIQYNSVYMFQFGCFNQLDIINRNPWESYHHPMRYTRYTRLPVSKFLSSGCNQKRQRPRSRMMRRSDEAREEATWIHQQTQVFFLFRGSRLKLIWSRCWF